MNIFILDNNPELAARFHNDKHVVKMTLEYAQLLSTAHHVIDGPQESPFYKPTHINHPDAVWVRSYIGAYNFVYDLFEAVSKEYTYRYGREHLCWTKLGRVLDSPPKNINTDLSKILPVPKCMPDSCKVEDPVESYRNYYREEKSRMASWKNREVPYWYETGRF